MRVVSLLLLLQLISEKHMTALWGIAQPFLFGLIGAAVDFTQITPSVVGENLCVILTNTLLNLYGNSETFHFNFGNLETYTCLSHIIDVFPSYDSCVTLDFSCQSHT